MRAVCRDHGKVAAAVEGSALREAHPWLLWCLPLAGLAIVGLYKLLKTEGQGTNNVFDQVRQGRALSDRAIRPTLEVERGAFLGLAEEERASLLALERKYLSLLLREAEAILNTPQEE